MNRRRTSLLIYITLSVLLIYTTGAKFTRIAPRAGTSSWDRAVASVHGPDATPLLTSQDTSQSSVIANPVVSWTGLRAKTIQPNNWQRVSAPKQNPATHLSAERRTVSRTFTQAVTASATATDSIFANNLLPITKMQSVSSKKHHGYSHSTSKAITAFEEVADTPPRRDSREEIGQFTVTAYALSEHSTGKLPGQPGFGITASGSRAVVGRTVAVDPSVIPIGTLVYIDLPGVGWRLAEDTGGAIRGNHIDLLLPSDQVAYKFGVKRRITVYAMPK